MAETIYRAFISSTKDDLLPERRMVHEALIDCDCFPAAMEQFVAAHDDQWTYIKRENERCDFYIVIVGGRYGSCIKTGPLAGISYTEAEYDYALEKDRYIMGFIKRNAIAPAGSAGFREDSPDAAKRLEAFRTKVGSRMCSIFDDEKDMQRAVLKALVFAKRSTKTLGYVRADSVTSSAHGAELLAAQRRIAELEKQISDLSLAQSNLAANLAHGEDIVRIECSVHWKDDFAGTTRAEANFVRVKWDEIFQVVALAISNGASNEGIRAAIAASVRSRFTSQNAGELLENVRLADSSFHKIRIQLRELGLVAFAKDEWSLTKVGDLKMVRLTIDTNEDRTTLMGDLRKRT